MRNKDANQGAAMNAATLRVKAAKAVDELRWADAADLYERTAAALTAPGELEALDRENMLGRAEGCRETLRGEG